MIEAAHRDARLRSASLALAIAVSLGLVLSAPFAGQLRAAIRQTFPGHFVLIVGTMIAIGLCAALVAAVRRITDRRVERYGAIVVAIMIAAGYAIRNAGTNPESNVVELFHFLQYGLIAFLFYRVWRPLGDLAVLLLPVLAGLVVGAVEEWFQWFIPNRVGELNDVFLNLVAIGCGLLFSLAVLPPDGRFLGLLPSSRRRVAAAAAVALLALAAFVHIVHLGYRVEDETIGSFVSRYPKAELLSLQQARAARWRSTPPPVKLVRLSREDQYLTEGIQHVRERNDLWDAGNVRGAWLENLILERYYEPILDTPTHEGPAHRWPPGQRADAESRQPSGEGQSYVSAAYPSRIYTWSKPLFWLVAGLLIALVLVAGGGLRGNLRKSSS